MFLSIVELKFHDESYTVKVLGSNPSHGASSPIVDSLQFCVIMGKIS